MLPWLLCGGLAAGVVTLLVRLWLFRNSVNEISRQLEERLASDTNNPIFVPTRDVQARKLAASLNVQLKELRRLRQRYENGDQEVKEAVTNVSHDLRTPLTAIRGYLDLLEREELSENAARYLNNIENRMDAMTHLTEELFRWSLASDHPRLAREEADLRRCLEETLVSFYAAMGQRGIVPEIDLPDRPVIRQVDSAAAARVFGNIISNALKYSGGDLTVSLSEDGTAVFSNAAPGVDPVDAQRLFDRFYTVETGRDSTGLGLSIARTLTERMGGTIQAEHREGRLNITVSFPAAEAR